ncbi:histone H1.0-like [Rhinoraja longicauda]
MADNSTGKPKRGKAAKKPPTHPKYAEMIIGVITDSASRSGLSRQAIQKLVKSQYKLTDNADGQIKLSLVKLVTKGVLEKTKGVGASGSFKISKGGEPQKAVKKAKKPVRKTASPKKPVKAKKPAKPMAKAKKAKVQKAVKKAAGAAKGAKKAKPAKTKALKAKPVKRSPKKAKSSKPRTKTSAKKMAPKKK